MKKDLEQLRREINDVNLELLKRLNLRASLVHEISQLKDERHMDYFDPVREQEMLEHILKSNEGPLPEGFVKEIFKTIFLYSLKYMEAKRDNLLVSAKSGKKFGSIHEIFGLPTDTPVVIAGPCAVENARYLESVAAMLQEKGMAFLRGGAYKPRTSPYEFQGLKEEGLKLLQEMGKKYNLITITEAVDTRDVEMMTQYIDVIQIGARNMDNFELLKEVGQTKRPVLLKRGMSATIQELIFAAEYMALQGNRKIILCERGIRTFENQTRNTLDISSIPILKKETSLPVVVDLSHSLGRKDIVNPIGKAAIAAGADGIMVEVHPHPHLALSDSKQQLNPQEFEVLLKELGYY